MPIYKGDRANPTAIYFGDSSLGKVYRGDNLVWQKTTTNWANSKFGLLYNWYAATDTRNIASNGWHIPAYNEWNILVTYAGGISIAGGKLKETGTTHWDSPNTGATNEYAFNARGAGLRIAGGMTVWFDEIKCYCGWWTSTDDNPEDKYIAVADNTSSNLVLDGGGMPYYGGCSLRLIKDDNTLANYLGNDGKTYQTVKIGDQVWMAENLEETKYRNGDTIPEVTDDSSWAALTTGALCAYDNNWDNV